MGLLRRFVPIVWIVVLADMIAGVFLLLLQVDTTAAAAAAWMTPHDASLMRHHRSCAPSRATATRLFNTGGWGIGPQRELKPEEFVNGKGGSSNYRRAASFEGYQLRDRGEFMRQVAVDKDSLQKGALDELLGVAASAGIQVKDPNERLNKFSSEDASDEIEYDDTLDVSVQWDDETDASSSISGTNNNASPSVGSRSAKDTESITRLDEDTGALGVW